MTRAWSCTAFRVRVIKSLLPRLVVCYRYDMMLGTEGDLCKIHVIAHVKSEHSGWRVFLCNCSSLVFLHDR